MPTITVTLDLTDLESRVLDTFLVTDGRGETREQAASRLAFLWLRRELTRIQDDYHRDNTELIVQSFKKSTTKMGQQKAACAALGLDFDGLVVTPKPGNP